MQMTTEAKPFPCEINLTGADGQVHLSIADRAAQVTGDLISLELGPDEAEQLSTQLAGPNYSFVDYEDAAFKLKENDWQVFSMSGLGAGARQPVFLRIADEYGDEAVARLTLAEAHRLSAALTETN